MAKRNEDKLSLIYDKKQKDFVVKYPNPQDGALAVGHILGDVLKYRVLKDPPFNFDVTNFRNELEKRGYDLSTLKFSIELKKTITL